MQKLFDTYHSYEPSQRCWLDGDYFNVVFEEYDGLIHEPITVEITSKGNNVSGPEEFDLPPNAFGLVRVKIVIKDKSDSKTTRVIRHSNLLVIDQDRKEALRFEPMFENRYDRIINTELEKYVHEFLPEYTFVEIENHPQKFDRMCEDKGMCVAYVIKAALMYVMGVADLSDDEDSTEESLDDIKRFASAVETIFDF